MNPVQPPSGAPVEIEVVPHLADLNHAAYDPRLFQGVDYFATSSAVRGRFEADAARYAAENRFYALLDSAAEVAARFGRRGAGDIVIYRLGARAQRALAAGGPLDPLWWAEGIPAVYRERAESVLRPAQPSGGAVRNPDGSPAAWVTSLRLIYEFQFSDFAVATGIELAERGRFAEARRFAEATLVMAPDNVQPCVLYALCSERLGEWEAARSATERSLGALAAIGEESPTLHLQHAEILAHLGDRDGARRELETVAAAGGGLADEARRRLEALH